MENKNHFVEIAVVLRFANTIEERDNAKNVEDLPFVIMEPEKQPV